MLQYRTFYAEYTGQNSEEVIQAVYADARLGTGLSFDKWWQYQQGLWDSRYAIKVPSPNSPDAARELLDILLKVGALEETRNV